MNGYDIKHILVSQNTTYTMGKYYSSTNGTDLLSNNTLFVSDLIKIDPSAKIYHNFYNCFVCLYDKNKEFITSTISGDEIASNMPRDYTALAGKSVYYIRLIGETPILTNDPNHYYAYYFKNVSNKFITIPHNIRLSTLIKYNSTTEKYEYSSYATIATIDIFNITAGQICFIENATNVNVAIPNCLEFDSDGNYLGSSSFARLDNKIILRATNSAVSKICVMYNSLLWPNVNKVIVHRGVYNVNKTAGSSMLLTNSDIPIKTVTLDLANYAALFYINDTDIRTSADNSILGTYLLPLTAGVTYEIGCNIVDMNWNYVIFNSDYTYKTKIAPGSNVSRYTPTANEYIHIMTNISDSTYTEFYLKSLPLMSLSQLTGLQSGLILLSNAYKEVFNEKVWASLGDSITGRGGWQDLVANYLGLVHHNCGIGSTPMSGTNANAYWQDVRLNAVKSYNPDLVTVFAASNDLIQNPYIGTESDIASKDTNTIIGALSYIVDNLLTWKPSLKLVIMGQTWAHEDGTTYSQTITYGKINDALELVAKHYGLPFCDLYHKAAYNTYTMGSASNHKIYGSDTIHPNTEGQKVIANLLISTLIERYFPYWA